MVFENIENTILVFFENCSCYLNLVFSMFSLFCQNSEKLGIKRVLPVLLVLLVFENRKQFSKRGTKLALRAYLVLVFENCSLRTIFKNTKNTIVVVFSESSSYSLNLVFFVFFVTKNFLSQTCFPYFT